MKISIKLVTVLCALALGTTLSFAQQKVAWKGQKMVFVLPEGEMKTTADDEKTFSMENEKQFFKAEIVRDVDAAKRDLISTLFKNIEMNKAELVNKGDVFKTESGIKGHYAVGKTERGMVAYCIFFMEKHEFPLLVSFPVENEEPKEEIMKTLTNIYSM